MIQINVDFSQKCGRIKPMHAVNNGPVYKPGAGQRITNLEAYREARIPYARTHDSSFFSGYGGEHTIDVHAIFPDFKADENDPGSYDFKLSDEYIQVIRMAGTEPFYRLGSKIEHWSKKYGIIPPPDFRKWAGICEHIIAHYTQGWADGFYEKITYWEIWNEPETTPCWAGTKEQFFELFKITAKHLKKCFPDLKIGGPGACLLYNQWHPDFLQYCRENEVPLDFFSWHVYSNDPYEIRKLQIYVRNNLDAFGFIRTESILDEWNYIVGWDDEQWIKSLRTEKSLKGASFSAAVMALSQYSPVDMLMYYDARPCGMNGLFNTDFVCECLKGYYPFKMFSSLYSLKDSVSVESDSAEGFAVAAASEDKKAVLVTRYADVDVSSKETLKVCLNHLGSKGPVSVKCLLLDEKNDMKLQKEEILCSDDASIFLDTDLFSIWLVMIDSF